jgi:hypothetical protein
MNFADTCAVPSPSQFHSQLISAAPLLFPVHPPAPAPPQKPLGHNGNEYLITLITAQTSRYDLFSYLMALNAAS